MFKKASLRFFAGMLFGSSAGVFVGMGFSAVAVSHLPDLPEIDRMRSLLLHVIAFAFFGLALGGLVALAPRPLVAGFVSAGLGGLAMFLSVAIFGPQPEAIGSRLGFGMAIMAVAALGTAGVMSLLGRREAAQK